MSLFSAGLFGPDIPDSAVEQWTATSYDDSNNEWVGQLSGVNLTGGSASKTTDVNGNTVVRYDGTSGQGHSTTQITIPHDRVSAIVVKNESTTSSHILINDPSDGNVFCQLGDSNNGEFRWGNTGQSFTSSRDLSVLRVDGDVVSSSVVNSVFENGTKLAEFSDGQTGYKNGVLVAEYSTGGVGFVGDILEILLYEDATDEELSSEENRLQAKYSGVSF
jgi:hypothetical protein